MCTLSATCRDKLEISVVINGRMKQAILNTHTQLLAQHLGYLSSREKSIDKERCAPLTFLWSFEISPRLCAFAICILLLEKLCEEANAKSQIFLVC